MGCRVGVKRAVEERWVWGMVCGIWDMRCKVVVK